MRKLFLALALAVAMAGLSQAASVVKPAVVPSRAPARLPDAQIQSNIRAKFAKSKINVEHFTVTVQNGVATIEGKTNVIQHKGVATRMAKTGGAVAVRNQIQISEEAKAKAAAKLAQYRNGSTNGQGGTQVARATVLPAVKTKP